jgi:hypothetical protein
VRDLLLRPYVDRVHLGLVACAPLPFPPDRLRWATTDLVRHELDRADRSDGQRGLILQTLDALGIGFDS